MVLDAYERAGRRRTRPRDRRHRVEHIETITRADIPRFAELGVVASMQPYHADPSPNQIDMWAGNIGKERAGQAWSWASIRKAGGVIALGSDWPVVPFDPMLALNSAVNRQTKEGHPPGGWLPSEKLSLPEALAAYGHGSAYRGLRGPPSAGRCASERSPMSSCWTAISSPMDRRPSSARRWPSPSSAARSSIARRSCREALHHRGHRRGDRVLRAHPVPAASSSTFTGETQGLIVLGVIFGVVNGLIGPIVKMLSLPISVLTMGLAGILVNAGLLLLVAFIANSTGFALSIGDFPPDLLTADTIVAAVDRVHASSASSRGCVNAVVP